MTAPRSAEPTPEDAWAAGAALADHVDLRRGLVITVHVDGETRPEGVGEEGHHCAPEALASIAAELARYLADRRSWDPDAAWVCAGDRCELSGAMEFDPVRVLRFDRDDRGRLVVVALQTLGIVGVTDEHAREVRASAEAELRERSGPCTQR